MAQSIPRFEAGDTRQFTITYSVAPGSRPSLGIFTGSGEGSLVYSTSATSSSSTQWFGFWTVTNVAALNPSGADALYEWVASYSDGPVVTRGRFRIIKTIPG